MSFDPEHLAIIIALAILTVSMRVAGFVIDTRMASPTLVQALSYVPVAAFAALILPGLMVPGEIGIRAIAAICTGVLALRFGRLWVALLVGMAVFWGLRAVEPF